MRGGGRRWGEENCVEGGQEGGKSGGREDVSVRVAG